MTGAEHRLPVEERLAVEDFLVAEAELLDEARFVEWTELLAEDVRYRVLAPVAGLAEAPPREGVLLWDETLSTLRARAAQLGTPAFTLAENPRSVDRRLVGNVRASAGGAGLVEARSNLLLRRARAGVEPYLVTAARRDVLRRAGGGFRLVAREVRLDDMVVAPRMLGTFF